jgi:holo-[acyl-carrier protein] synthase
MIRAIGIDIVQITRIERIEKRFRDRFLNRIFTPLEITYCRSRSIPARHLAARWAAKEAFIKALSPRRRISFKQVGVVSGPEGKPGLAWDIALQEEFGLKGVNAHLSLSHEQDFAVAMVVLEENK